MGAALDLDLLAELGVYDPGASDAAEVLEYLQWLADQGLDVAELARVTELEHFGAATAAIGMRPDAKPLAEHGEIGIDRERLARVANAFGFDPDIVARGVFTSHEITVLRAADEGSSMFSDAETLYFARVTGAALARVAEAAVSMFMVDIEAPRRHEALTLTQDAVRSQEALGALDVIVDALDPLFRLHMAQAVDRLHWGTEGAATLDTVRQAIGFIDLVGFSTLSTQISMADLSVVVREFEARAHELVSQTGARVVKIIGDAVMFTAVDPDPVVRAASSLLSQLGDRADVEARGGLTYGDVLSRGGDYYGPVVNLAARLGDLAVPGELLATPEFVAALTDEWPFEPAGRRLLKGFAEPVDTVSLVI